MWVITTIIRYQWGHSVVWDRRASACHPPSVISFTNNQHFSHADICHLSWLPVVGSWVGGVQGLVWCSSVS